MKFLAIAINWIANIFFGIETYLENHYVFSPIGEWFLKIGKKVYSDGFCERCGRWIIKESCFYGGDKLLAHPHCCGCEHGFTEKQTVQYEKRRRKFLAEYRKKIEGEKNGNKQK